MLTNKFQNATRTQLVEAMASSMIRHGEGCTAADIKLDGFSQAQIDAHGDAARELAMAKAETVTRARIPSRRAA
ncbi:hypothetical protein JNB71_03635 [Rhizobium herbae]|uniref:Uncharacterized protein n=1 Tax=Rhizobium herbae TaxID=508661 RepID=A0ABS7H5N1_9HYPH|nr:hypothetical protein [Rhizobium herbae]MBW9062403.1 hypothetical protein [Rhizobium herbae]